MSTHLLIAAAYLESAPGFAKLRAWSGLKRSQTTATVAQLVAGRYVELVEGGRLGRRAVYRVFPDGVPAIPRPSEVAARYSTDSSPVVDNSENEGPVHRPLGAGQPPTRGRSTGPLHAVTSVSTREAPTTPPPAVVDNRRPAPPAPGFPGSRASTAASAHEAREERRRARGAHNLPCPIHPDEVVPCRRCAHVAANADPATVAAARQAARQAIRTATSKEPTP